MRTNFVGRSVVSAMTQAPASAPRSLVIHGNYLDYDERAFLATHRDRMSLVYCPRTHAYFLHPPYPLAEMLAGGIQMALGTDSRASNPDLNMLAEMRHIARTHSETDPQEILRLGTLAGATALGRYKETGSITPGKLANLIAVSASGNRHDQPDDVLAELFSNELAPSTVWFRGQKQ